MSKDPDFIEHTTVKGANSVDMSVYTILERLSAARGTFCFKKRAGKD